MAIFEKMKSFSQHASQELQAAVPVSRVLKAATTTMGAAGTLGAIATGVAGSAQDQVRELAG